MSRKILVLFEKVLLEHRDIVLTCLALAIFGPFAYYASRAEAPAKAEVVKAEATKPIDLFALFPEVDYDYVGENGIGVLRTVRCTAAEGNRLVAFGLGEAVVAVNDVDSFAVVPIAECDGFRELMRGTVTLISARIPVGAHSATWVWFARK